MASVSGRTELVGEYVEFLDVDIPLSITASFAVVGSLVMLFIYDPLVGAVAAALAIPVTLLSGELGHRRDPERRAVGVHTQPGHFRPD